METVAGSLTIPTHPSLPVPVPVVAAAEEEEEEEEVVVVVVVVVEVAVAVAGNRARNDTATSQEVWIREQGQAQ